MKEYLEKIIELPVYFRFGILLFPILLIGAVYYFLLYGSINEQISDTLKSVDSLNLEIVQKTAVVANLQKYIDEVNKLDAELNQALKELPNKKEIALLLQSISDKARDAGLEIRLFQPQPDAMKDFYAEVPVQVELKGSYHQVAAFFDEVAHLERIVNVDQFGMGEPKILDESIQILATAMVTSFRFLDENERPKQEDQAKGKRRKRGRQEDKDSEKI